MISQGAKHPKNRKMYFQFLWSKSDIIQKVASWRMCFKKSRLAFFFKLSRKVERECEGEREREREEERKTERTERQRGEREFLVTRKWNEGRVLLESLEGAKVKEWPLHWPDSRGRSR